ncbi:MAG: hypothetical protein U9P90_04040 [Patescibacteria group bacterium]|nr:hypothetical protein [Patescibacteria group bacterium]
MSKNNPSGIDFGSIGDAMKDLQNAYSDGLAGINQTNEEVKEDIDPSHTILIDVKISAQVESHNYKIDAHLEFLADLNSILNSETGDIASLVDGLGVNLSDEESNQVVEQLGKPRCIGVLDEFKINEIELNSDQGKIEKGINDKATMLIILEDKKLCLSFESVFALPDLQASKTIYNAIPSQEKMQQNVVFDSDNLNSEIKFKWSEKDKDNLKIEGSASIKKLKE